MSLYTPAQRTALAFAALDKASADWRHGINREHLSFTEEAQTPLGQLYGSIAAGMVKLYLVPGSASALGFAALDEADAERLLEEWLRLLAPARYT